MILYNYHLTNCLHFCHIHYRTRATEADKRRCDISNRLFTLYTLFTREKPDAACSRVWKHSGDIPSQS